MKGIPFNQKNLLLIKKRTLKKKELNIMKKTLIIVSLVLVIVATLYGCIASRADTNSDTSTPAVEEKIDLSIFPEVEACHENLDIYREEVSKRLASLGEDDAFISDAEWEAISESEWFTETKFRHNAYFTTFSKLYEETSAYYYPVVFRDGSQLILWYTTEYGSLHFERIYGYAGIRSNYGGEVHYDISDDEEIINQEVEYTLTYTQETGEVKVWKFGTVVDNYSVPKNSVYCGFSYFEGYIFRNGTDVYSLNAIDTHTTDGSVKCIAHNVQYVIDADYYYGSDPWCQPLFQMTDGSIKCYIGWMSDENVSPDDPSHLCDLQYEGSWDK